MSTTRCEWANSDPLYVSYHDTEWGVPAGQEGEAQMLVSRVKSEILGQG